MKRLLVVFLAAVAVVAGSSVAAQASVDGLLDDWGIMIDGSGHLVYDAAYGATYNPSTAYPFTIYSGTNVSVNGRKVSFQIEDTNDINNSYRVGPLWGGQNYDAEALLVSLVGDDLYIAIATGQRPDNLPDARFYAPGDISIVTQDNTVWGIEVGGGQGGKTTTYANGLRIEEGSAGTTYVINDHGYTSSSFNTPGQTAGSIWKTDGTTSSVLDLTKDWQIGIEGPDSTRPRTQMIGGIEQKGQADYAYNFGVGYAQMGNPFGQHAFIELVVENYYDVFENSLSGAKIQWAPVCGNDQLMLTVTLPPKGDVPEPASVIVWTLLIAAAGWGIWRRKRA